MSGGKFASITASLLARKGDAHPSTMPDAPVHKSFAWSGAGASPPTVHRQFDKLDRVYQVPPPDRRDAEREAPVRTPDKVRDLRFEQPPEVLLEEVPEKDEPPPVVAHVKARDAKEPSQIDKPRRLFVNLTPDEYERMGIIAVKRDSTRHRLLRDALDALLKRAAKEYKADCACLATGGCKGACQ